MNERRDCVVLDDFLITLPNRIDDVNSGSPHWYISYNSYEDHYGGATTALVLGQMEYFLILNGDHRIGFQNAIKRNDPGQSRLSKCLKYIRENKAQLNKLSNYII